MKLALATQDGIAILTGNGEIGAHDLDVLRAGFSKLLKSGRNRIVFEIPESEKIPGEVIREISRFDVLARELSGRIILAGNEALCARVAQFARPPVIPCFVGRERAIQELKGRAPAAEDAAPKPVAPPVSVAAAAVAAVSATQAGDAQAKYKADIRQKELTDLTSLRKRVSQLENENRLLMEQLLSTVGWAVGSASEAAQTAQIAALNQKIEGLLLQLKK